MIKIVSGLVSDVLPTASGVVLARRPDDAKDPAELSFFEVDVAARGVRRVEPRIYLIAKFGRNYDRICAQISSVFECSACVTAGGDVFVVYTDGQTVTFDPDGNLLTSGELFYRGEPVMCCAADGEDVWCAVPKCDSIVRYSRERDLITMRIGGTSATSFKYPVGLYASGGRLFISSYGSRNVKSVDLGDYSVADVVEFTEPALRYYPVPGGEVVALSSGVYIL